MYQTEVMKKKVAHQRRVEKLLRRNDKELNEVKSLFSNKIYHFMKNLGGEYWNSRSEESGCRTLTFSHGNKNVDVTIRVTD
jgi:hypothetical protein